MTKGASGQLSEPLGLPTESLQPTPARKNAGLERQLRGRSAPRTVVVARPLGVRSRWLASLVGGILLLGSVEVTLRALGFAKAALYVSDADYEYIHAPGQSTRPFGNLVLTNSLGMRSRELRVGETVRAIVIGDSVVNGGNPTDHADLATTILEGRVQERYGSNQRVLNVSAGSWGPDNAAAFLRKHGFFGAKHVIAVFSSHDLGDVMTHQPVVGRDANFPNRPAYMATTDALARYLWPKLRRAMTRGNHHQRSADGIDKFNGFVNPGWERLRDLCRDADVRLSVVLHMEDSERQSGHLNHLGQRLLGHLRQLGIEPVLESGLDERSYRDSIHLSAKGQRDLARILEPLVIE